MKYMAGAQYAERSSVTPQLVHLDFKRSFELDVAEKAVDLGQQGFVLPGGHDGGMGDQPLPPLMLWTWSLAVPKDTKGSRRAIPTLPSHSRRQNAVTESVHSASADRRARVRNGMMERLKRGLRSNE